MPPPDIPPPVTPTAPAITAVTPTPPTEPHVIAPPPPVAPPRRRRRSPRSAAASRAVAATTRPIRARRSAPASTKGRVVARLQIDEKGNVTEVNIVSSEPPRVFDKAVRDALKEWKFKAEGEKYVGEVEINFTLKDELDARRAARVATRRNGRPRAAVCIGSVRRSPGARCATALPSRVAQRVRRRAPGRDADAATAAAICGSDTGCAASSRYASRATSSDGAGQRDRDARAGDAPTARPPRACATRGSRQAGAGSAAITRAVKPSSAT